MQSLHKYIKDHNLSVQELSKRIGKTRQSIYNWLELDATVELTDIGIRIKTEKIVHETQVKK